MERARGTGPELGTVRRGVLSGLLGGIFCPVCVRNKITSLLGPHDYEARTTFRYGGSVIVSRSVGDFFPGYSCGGVHDV